MSSPRRSPFQESLNTAAAPSFVQGMRWLESPHSRSKRQETSMYVRFQRKVKIFRTVVVHENAVVVRQVPYVGVLLTKDGRQTSRTFRRAKFLPQAKENATCPIAQQIGNSTVHSFLDQRFYNTTVRYSIHHAVTAGPRHT